MVFNAYSGYYDTLYTGKDYSAEVDYLEVLVRKHAAGKVQAVLDLGCGTGGHAIPLARRGYQVDGVDLSSGMLEQARLKAARAGVEVNWHQGDLCSMKLDKQFDLAVSMFAVMSYQTSNDAILRAFEAVHSHLKPGALFLFDAWYGPAVLHQRPEDRVKWMSGQEERILRLAHPELNLHQNTVTVHYELLKLSENRVVDEVREAHQMRFFFEPEVDLLARAGGFQVLECTPFMQEGIYPTEEDWNVTWILRAA